MLKDIILENKQDIMQENIMQENIQKKHHARKTGKKIAINATIGQKINLIASLKKNSLKRRKHVLKKSIHIKENRKIL